MSDDPDDEGGQVHTLGLLQLLRAQTGDLWGRSSQLYFHIDELLRQLSNPNLHDIANMSYRVELWDRQADHIRWTVAAAGSVSVAHAAFEQAVQDWPHEHFTLRQGIMLIREYPQKK
jgi:hypothetical protein